MDSHMDVLVSIYGKQVIDVILDSNSVWLQNFNLEDISNNIEAYLAFI